MVYELHMARHARHMRLAGRGGPQEHGEVVTPTHQPLRLAAGDGLVALQRHLAAQHTAQHRGA